jgi:peptidoglycan LD-endopeptidase CwlK
MSSRKIDDLVPELRDKAILFREKMTSLGIDFIITCTRRSMEEQEALYAQGRTAPGPIVTWTLDSKHISGHAFDIAICKSGKISWIPTDYETAGTVGESLGLKWGGRFHKPDRPHFEI